MRENQIVLSQAAQPITALQVPAPAGLSYLPGQLVGIEYAHHNESTLLADEMGLGKTIQAIGFLNLETSLSSVHIIAPPTVKLNWKRELQRWLTGNLTVGIATAKKWPDTDIIILHPEIALSRIFRHESTRVSTLRQAVALAEAHVQSWRQCGGVAYKLAVDELRQTHLSQINEIARLRHETALAKVPLVIEQVSAMLDNSEDKVAVWAHHQDVIQALREGLSSFGTVSVVGGDSVNARQHAVDEFQEGVARVIIGSIQAAGVGITLTRASRVVFAELDWVPGNISQCEDRCHRIGQSDTVHCLHIVVNGSVDAMLAEAIVTKQEVITQALDGHDAQEADMLKMLETLYRGDDREVEEATVEAVGQTMS